MKYKSNITNMFLLNSFFILSTFLLCFILSKPSFANSELVEITVYKTPTCGCCSKWVSHLESNGFKVTAIDQNDLSSIKAHLGIAPNLQACHTAQIGNYFVEGHVPAADIKKMLATKPNIKGIVVPGMPMGSPGMEGSRVDRYDVLAINQNATITVFSRY